MPKNKNKNRILFYSAWLTLLFVQAYYTELIDDEAYYWIYSRQLSWGYFDHPPMIALMIKAGYAIFQNELGVRLFPILASFSSLVIIEKLLNKKDFFLYAVLASSILVVQVGGFLAVPDSPYLFFITLFIYQFKRYLEKDDFLNAFILGILSSCILYSKYHGAMLLFFIVLGQLSLLKRRSFYIIIVTGILCYLPHIIWLVQNDYPSFYYHFGERNVPSYTLFSTIEYIIGQFAIYGPIASFFIFCSLFKFTGENSFERVLKFICIAVFLFLFLFSFIGTIEANWALAILIPLIIITHQFLVGKPRLKKIFYYTAPVSVLLLIIIRTYLLYDFTGGKLKTNVDFHHKREWAMKIQEKAGILPVVFINSYQKASIYSFYTGEKAISLNNIQGRMNQYNLSSMEDSLQGKKVFIVANWPTAETNSFFIREKEIRYTTIEKFSSFSKIYFYNLTHLVNIIHGENLILKVKMDKRYCDRATFASNTSLKSHITYHYYIKRKCVYSGNTGIELNPNMVGKEMKLDITTPPEKGVYYLRVSITTGWLPPTFNSKKWKVIVE